MNEFKEKIMKLMRSYPGTFIGCLSGLLLGLLVIIFGLGKVLILIIFIVLGFIIGRMRDQ